MNICTKKVLRVVISVRSPYRCLYTGTDDDANDVVHKLMNVFFFGDTSTYFVYIFIYIYNLSTGSVSSFHGKCTVIVRIITLI